MPPEPITVSAYSGHRGEETPRTFFLHGQRIDVVEVLRMWVGEEPEGMRRRRYFEVKGNDGFVYRMFYDEGDREWFLDH